MPTSRLVFLNLFWFTWGVVICVIFLPGKVLDHCLQRELALARLRMVRLTSEQATAFYARDAEDPNIA